MKNALASRTVWMGIIITVLGVAQTFAPELPIKPIYQAAFDVVVGVLIVVLRFDTRDSIVDR